MGAKIGTGVAVSVGVLAGQRRERVGAINLAVGMLTNRGIVVGIRPSGVVLTKNADGKVQRTRDPGKLSVRLTEARKFGYPDAAGCRRDKEVLIKRAGETLRS